MIEENKTLKNGTFKVKLNLQNIMYMWNKRWQQTILSCPTFSPLCSSQILQLSLCAAFKRSLSPLEANRPTCWWMKQTRRPGEDGGGLLSADISGWDDGVLPLLLYTLIIKRCLEGTLSKRLMSGLSEGEQIWLGQGERKGLSFSWDVMVVAVQVCVCVCAEQKVGWSRHERINTRIIIMIILSMYIETVFVYWSWNDPSLMWFQYKWWGTKSIVLIYKMYPKVESKLM